MVRSNYQSDQLIVLLQDIQNKQASGALYLDAEINSQREKRSRVLIWKNGTITYGGLKVPSSQEFVKILGQKSKREVDIAFNLAMQKATNKTSVRALLELLVRMRLFTWEQIEAIVHSQVVLTLEQVLPHAGQLQFDTTAQFDLCHGEICYGLNLSSLMLDVNRRQEQWSEFAPLVPSMEAVPHLQAGALQKIADPTVRQHLQEMVNGQRALVDIADALDKDPLSIATSYLHWVQAGWIMFEGSKPIEKSLPTVLAVDDSLVMQTMIKRALTNYYRVLVASNAADGLSLLHNNKVALLLLDVSMPDMDGLEVCRQVRNMPEFRNLPIIMLTARDGFVDKVKGQIAGANQYLIKPFEFENLRQVVRKYVGAGIVV